LPPLPSWPTVLIRGDAMFGRRLGGLEDLRPGQWMWRECVGSGPATGRWLWFLVPGSGCGGTGLHAVPIKPAVNTLGAGWDWDGNEIAPTLGPSILCDAKKGGCGWHGYIRGGRIVSA
jgi:Family of unknown function (DUF6527)